MCKCLHKILTLHLPCPVENISAASEQSLNHCSDTVLISFVFSSCGVACDESNFGYKFCITKEVFI